MDFPAIDPVKTGDNMRRLALTRRRRSINGKTERRCLLWIILSVSQRCCASGWMISSSQIVPEFSVGS